MKSDKKGRKQFKKYKFFKRISWAIEIHFNFHFHGCFHFQFNFHVHGCFHFHFHFNFHVHYFMSIFLFLFLFIIMSYLFFSFPDLEENVRCEAQVLRQHLIEFQTFKIIRTKCQFLCRCFHFCSVESDLRESSESNGSFVIFVFIICETYVLKCFRIPFYK